MHFLMHNIILRTIPMQTTKKHNHQIIVKIIAHENTVVEGTRLKAFPSEVTQNLPKEYVIYK